VHGIQADNLWLVNRPVFPVRESEVTEVLLAARQIEAECGVPVRMVVIDTLARCFGGNDENDARDMGAFIEGCDVIKQKTGATVLVVHHSGKDEGKELEVPVLSALRLIPSLTLSVKVMERRLF
jgi:hypothetical protein